jgi:extracellular factor (EF) 3-hydroxypalmitic acid methyl ester biosynthesis protein
MVNGPTWNDGDRNVAAVRHSNDLLAHVRAVAESLVTDLDRAGRQTDGWRNAPLADALVDVALSRCLSRLAESNCWGPANRLPSGELWRIAGHLLSAGSLQNHARFKPRGYAGDFQMLERIDALTCCEDRLGRAFDRYFLLQAAPQAVRARTEQVASALAEHCLARRGPYHVASAGCGPAIDIERALALLPDERRREVTITLLDLDDAALTCARARLEKLAPDDQLVLRRTNLFRLPTASDGAGLPPTVNFLVCSGLFDYLEDPYAIAMLRLFAARLAPAGVAWVGNFAPHNPTRAYMEWVGNWYLTYRTAGDLARLAGSVELPQGTWSVGAERLGIDLFLRVARPDD